MESLPIFSFCLFFFFPLNDNAMKTFFFLMILLLSLEFYSYLVFVYLPAIEIREWKRTIVDRYSSMIDCVYQTVTA